MSSFATRQRLLLVVLLATLGSGAVLQIAAAKIYPRQQTVSLPLSKLLPTELPGWKITDQPLAATEELQGVVVKILQYDDTVFRIYTRQSLSVGIYVAYWRPGKVSYFDAGLHTPDTCWVYAGWERVKRQSGTPLTLASGRKTKPAETGLFRMNGQDQYVAFWHLVGGVVNTYNEYSWKPGFRGRIERFPSYVRDFFRFGLNQSQEQCFVRISSSVPIAALLKDPELMAIFTALSPFGLFENVH